MASREGRAVTNILDKIFHRPEAGKVGETGEHGELGSNAAGAKAAETKSTPAAPPAVPAAPGAVGEQGEHGELGTNSPAAAGAPVVEVPAVTNGKAAPNAEEIHAQIAGSLVLAGYSPARALELATNAMEAANKS